MIDVSDIVQAIITLLDEKWREKNGPDRLKHQVKSSCVSPDWNAAINIRDNYILSSTPKASEEQAVVIQPYVTIGNDQSQAYCLVQ